MDEAIILFFEARPALKVAAIEKAAGIPQSVLSKSLKCERDLPAEYTNKLVEVLILYGYDDPNKTWLD